MKKPLALAFLVLSLMLAVFATSTHPASAGLFGGGKKATPTPSPAPAPTATPEPPSVAIPRLEKKLKANPKDQQAAVELAGQFLSINRPDLAAPLTTQLLKAGVKSAQVYYFDGVVRQAAGDAAGALLDFQQASDLDPTNNAILGQLAQLYLQLNRAPDALRIANRAVIFNKTDPQSYLLLGSVYAQQKHYDDARAQYEKAAALDPKSAQPIVQIANTYEAQNNIPQA
ncbi:MAG: tetratricopeptide repeat protein, partial [Vulcanimicrobiaceae bacterium]